MFIHIKVKGLLFITLSWFASLALADVQQINQTVFYADFNDKVPGTVIGEGGNAFGEPSDLSSLTAEIVELSPGENYLEVFRVPASTNASSIRWDFLDGVEISTSTATISFQFTPSELDRYTYGVREAGGSSQTFLTVRYSPDGSISVVDAAGSIAVVNNNYSAGAMQEVSLFFDMDAGTSGMTINGETLFSNRLHGISDHGIGRLLTGYSGISNSSAFTLYNISVNVAEAQPLPLVLDVDFEDKVLGQPLGTGGAALDEPIYIPFNMEQQVISTAAENQALLLERIPTTPSVLMKWTFLNDIEAFTGIVTVESDVLFETNNQYIFMVRPNISSSQNFSTTYFSAGASVSVSDENGFAEVTYTYQTDQTYRLKYIFDLDNGTYTMLIDDDVLVENRAHGVDTEHGIGAFYFGFQSTASPTAAFVVDNIKVGMSWLLDDIIFMNNFESVP